MPDPVLIPPCVGWQEDLPAPDDAVMHKPVLCGKKTNYQDNIYLEVSRSLLVFRSFFLFFSMAVAAFMLYTAWLMVGMSIDVGGLVIDCVIFFLGLWMTLLFVRISICPPRDEPLRFNRIRRKIYAYNFRHTWWNPFGNWQVIPVSYDWSQVRAERWSQMGGLPNGGFIYKTGVMLSIVEPGTNKVIDRFPLGTMGADEHAWAYICTYMQEGPTALPVPGEPKDHNDVLWCEFGLRLAPKVTWPADMDLESRTAP